MQENSLRYSCGPEHPDALTLTLALTLMSGSPWRQNSRVKSLAPGCPASKGNSSSAGLLVNFNHKKGLGLDKHKIAQAE